MTLFLNDMRPRHDILDKKSNNSNPILCKEEKIAPNKATNEYRHRSVVASQAKKMLHEIKRLAVFHKNCCSFVLLAEKGV